MPLADSDQSTKDCRVLLKKTTNHSVALCVGWVDLRGILRQGFGLPTSSDEDLVTTNHSVALCVGWVGLLYQKWNTVVDYMSKLTATLEPILVQRDPAFMASLA